VEAGTDAEVVMGSLADPPRFAVLYDRHAGLVFRFLVRRVGRDVADELLGDTFRIAFERRATYQSARPNARPWLYGIATNLVARHRRAEGRRLRAMSRVATTPRPDRLADDDLAAALDAERLWPAVARAVLELPGPERDALLLYAWEELTDEEIAIALDIPVGTVRSRLNRARRRLRELRSTDGEQHDEIPTTGRGRIAP
jgi:RNA polymerase sigma-70 factor (ECF subfamily)